MQKANRCFCRVLAATFGGRCRLENFPNKMRFPFPLACTFSFFHRPPTHARWVVRRITRKQQNCVTVPSLRAVIVMARSRNDQSLLRIHACVLVPTHAPSSRQKSGPRRKCEWDKQQQQQQRQASGWDMRLRVFFWDWKCEFMPWILLHHFQSMEQARNVGSIKTCRELFSTVGCCGAYIRSHIGNIFSLLS